MEFGKALNTDPRVQNRYRFTSAKKQSKQVSANVFSSLKRQHRAKKTDGGDDDASSSFREELELANDKNPSENFSDFYRQVWPLAQSLPELIHHAELVVNLLLKCMLTSEQEQQSGTEPEIKAGDDDEIMDETTAVESAESPPRRRAIRHVVNLATADLLHLLSILARDLQHEIHPFVYSRILPRILTDMLNPPLSDNKQPVPIPVSLIETAFTTLAFIFHHDADQLISGGSLEELRQFYGPSLGHKRQVIRRLAAETFAPLIRKLKTDSAKKKHLRRVLRALFSASSNANSRAVTDATNGITMLLVETTTSVRGHLHSKGNSVIQCVLEFLASYNEASALVEDYFERLSSHVASGPAKSFDAIWVELVAATKLSKVTLSKLLIQVIRFKDGRFFLHERAHSLKVVVDGLLVQGEDRTESSEELFQLFFLSWKVVTSVDNFFPERLASLLLDDCNTVSVIRAYLEMGVETDAFRNGFAQIMAALAKKLEDDEYTLLLFHLVAKFQAEHVENDVLFPTAPRDFVAENKATVKSLLDRCSAHLKNKKKTARMEYVVRCVPFLLSLLGFADFSEHKKVLTSLQKQLNECHDNQQLVSTSILLEAFARIVILIGQDSPKWVKKLISSAIPCARRLLNLAPTSIFVMKSVAAFCQALEIHSLHLDEDSPDSIFDLLVPNLKRDRHLFRLYTLEILRSFPRKAYVVDMADLDLTDDLDEEQDRPTAESTPPGTWTNSLCDMIDLLWNIEKTDPGVETERALIGCIHRIGAIAKSGKLPVVYAEACANYLFGSFFIKYMPIWVASKNALVGLADKHHSIVWESFRAAMTDWENNLRVVVDDDELETNDGQLLDPEAHRRLCLAWDSSKGTNAKLFGSTTKSDDETTRGLNHASTDRETVFRELMKVLVAKPDLTMRNSRFVVEHFLIFLSVQYYATMKNDADFRELALDDDEIDGGSVAVAPDKSSKSNQGRLLAYLGVFAACKGGAKNFFKSPKLLTIFSVLLSHQDALIAERSFECLLCYKFPYVSPYEEVFRKLFDKGELRKALFEFSLSEEDGAIESEHRNQFLPLVVRALFGRVSAPSSKRSNETPTSRRLAVASTLMELSSDELFPFIYLMIRNYLPTEKTPDWGLVGNPEYKSEVLLDLESPAMGVSTQRHLGFLNLLSSMIEKLGPTMSDYVPALATVVLEITRQTTFSRNSLRDKNDSDDEERSSDNPERLRALRTVSVRCTSALMTTFAEYVDFTIYSSLLWSGISDGVAQLPRMVAKSRGLPAELSLLVVMSSTTSLRPMLKSNKAAVESVIRCVGCQYHNSGVDAALECLGNLLSNESRGKDESTTTDLLPKQAILLLEQFEQRYGRGIEDDDESGAKKFRPSMLSGTSRNETQVLLRIANLVLGPWAPLIHKAGLAERHVDTLSSLLVHLLCRADAPIANFSLVLDPLSVLLPQASKATVLEIFTYLSELFKTDCWAKLGHATRNKVIATLSIVGRCKGVGGAVQQISKLLVEMCAFHQKRVGEADYERMLPVLTDLSDDESEDGWANLTQQVCNIGDGSNLNLLSPLVYRSFSLLRDDDIVANRTAYKALRALIRQVTAENKAAGEETSRWSRFFEITVIPSVRSGLSAPNDQLYRHSVLLMGEISTAFPNSSSPNLHSDLSVLRNEENQDLDFFFNVVHVQNHRRCKAMERLGTKIGNTEIASHFATQSLSNVLLPIATRPIFYSASKDERLCQECVSSVTAIAKHLSWSKYNALMWTVLIRIDRHPSEEPLLTRVLCGILDGFHFDVVAQTKSETLAGENHGNAVWRAIEKRVIPKIDKLVVKKKNVNGHERQLLKVDLIVALLKLYMRFPTYYFETKLPTILGLICDSLKNKDSNTRDTARKSLGRLITTVGIDHLGAVIRYLALTLKEGYQLHVRMASLHHVLLEVSKMYQAPPHTVESLPVFDRCVPGIMDLVLQDLFGAAAETRDASGARIKYVKEAGGSKARESLELVSRLLVFDPENRNACSIQAVVAPFFEKVKDSTVKTKTRRLVNESLKSAVAGLMKNKSVKSTEMLRFALATIRSGLESGNIQNSETRISSTAKVVVWEPSRSNAAQTSKGAVLNRTKSQKGIRKVRDGEAAPKLTGTFRMEVPNDRTNDAACECALMFGLDLFLGTLKHHGDDGLKELYVSFITALTECVSLSRNVELTARSLRAISQLLKKGTERPPQNVVNSLSIKVFDLLCPQDTLVLVNNELSHICMVSLTLLLKLQKFQEPDSKRRQKKKLILSDDQTKVLLNLLKESLETLDDTSAPLGVIKVLVSFRFISPEMYDLMEVTLAQSVRSRQNSFREECGNIFVQFLLNYPMAETRFAEHLGKIMMNCKYEHADGRLSALRLVKGIVNAVPVEVLDRDVNILYLPLVLQLANDESRDCRDLITKILSKLLSRVSVPVAMSIYDKIAKWFDSSSPLLRRGSLQLSGLFVEARTDLVKDVRTSVIDHVMGGLGTDDDWEQRYYALICLQGLMVQGVEEQDKNNIWPLLLPQLSFDHSKVKKLAGSIVGNELRDLVESLKADADDCKSYLVTQKGTLFEIATDLCAELDQEESLTEEPDPATMDVTIASVARIARLMSTHAKLFYSDDVEEQGDPVKWLLTRLGQIAKQKGALRRCSVFKSLAAISNVLDGESSDYLQLAVEPLNRSVVEAEAIKDGRGNEKASDEAALAKEVLFLMEEQFGDAFFAAYAYVKTKMMQRREKRKERLINEEQLDPEGAALRKRQKHSDENDRRKRRREEHYHKK